MSDRQARGKGRGGLAIKLVLVQLLWMLPALGLADYCVLLLETARLERGLAEGRLEAVAAQMARELEGQPAQSALLTVALDRQRLLLERARGGLAEGAGHILVELSERPLSLRLQDVDGHTLAHSGPPLLPADRPAEGLHRQSSLPLQLADGTPATLTVQLAVPYPGLALLGPRSFEGSLLVLAALVLALSGGVLLSLYLAHRLGRIRTQVMAWRSGELGGRIDASQRDELGVLAADLDAMAADLEQLLQDRARLAALEERQRVARDLHDTVKQKAFALGLQLSALRRGQDVDGATLAQAERLCAEIREELAEVVHTMHPQPRSTTAFRDRLTDRVRNWQQSASLELDCSHEPGPEPSAAVAEQLLRALDESLANVARHAGPCRVAVRFRRLRDDSWQLQVSDDGCGFDPATRQGRGLQHLRERAEAIAGELQLLSGPSGTTVSLCFRLPDPGASDRPRSAWQRRWRPVA